MLVTLAAAWCLVSSACEHPLLAVLNVFYLAALCRSLGPLPVALICSTALDVVVMLSILTTLVVVCSVYHLLLPTVLGVACPQRCCNALDSDGTKMRAVGWRCSYGTPLENIFLGLLYSRAGTAIWPLRYPIWVTSVGGSLTPFSRQQLPLFLLTYRRAAAPPCTIPRSRTLWSISLSGGPI
jgi:hypothetical protein